MQFMQTMPPICKICSGDFADATTWAASLTVPETQACQVELASKCATSELLLRVPPVNYNCATMCKFYVQNCCAMYENNKQYAFFYWNDFPICAKLEQRINTRFILILLFEFCIY